MWFLIILIIFAIILFIIYIKFRKRKKTPITLFSGRNGGGKSFSMSHDARHDIRANIRYWKRINKPFLSKVLYIIPFFNKKRKNKEIYGLNEPNLYSTYPIIIRGSKGNEIISKPVTLEMMLLQEPFPLESIVVIDEFSSWINQFEFNETFSEVLNDHIQKWRHYHGNRSRLYIADQCTNNIPIQVRYRCNNAICCVETKHILKFIHITKYKYIDLTDNIKSVEIIDNDNADSEDKTLRVVRFGLKKIYDDRAYSNRYNFIDNDNTNSKYIDSILKVNETIKKPIKDKKYHYITIDEIIEKEKSDNK